MPTGPYIEGPISTEMDQLLWTEKYRFIELSDETRVNDFTIRVISNWLAEWTKGTTLLLCGQSGCGKTTACHLATMQNEIELIEVNTSIDRDLKPLYASKPCQCILVDDIADGPMEELKSLIKASNVPVICTCDDQWSKEAKAIKALKCKLVLVPPVPSTEIQKVLEHIIEQEGIKPKPSRYQLAILSSMHGGDLCACINALQFNYGAVMTSSARDADPLDTFTMAKQMFATKRVPDVEVDRMADFIYFNYITACTEGTFGLKSKPDMSTLDRISKSSEELSRYYGVDSELTCQTVLVHCCNAIKDLQWKHKETDGFEGWTPMSLTYHEPWTKVKPTKKRKS